MSPIDATSPNPFGAADPAEMAKAMTMLCMLLLSRQEHMMVELPAGEYESFPYSSFRLTVSEDKETGTMTWLLVDSTTEVH